MLEWSTDKRKLGDLAEWPLNPRQVTEDEASRLRESLSEFGQVLPICIDPDDIIIDGHQRRKVWGMADEFGMDFEVDVRVASRRLTEAERKKLTVFLEKAKGGWDFDKLANHFEVDELLDWGFEQEELGLDMWGEEENLEDPGAQVDKAEELREKWGVESGQLWQLGEHRVICGDSTAHATLDELMGDQKASICVTDPPYGVKYIGGTKKWPMLENDDEINMYAGSLPLIYEFTESKASLYLFYASGRSLSVFTALSDANYHMRTQIIWNKNHAQFGAMGAQYKHKHEPIAYCHKVGRAPYWFGPNNEVSVWDVDRASAHEYHPTEKPVELYNRAIQNSGPKGTLVLEPFLGSGTAIVASEQLGMVCYGAELDPKYVAVTLERWHEMTGEMPLQLDT